MFRGLSHVAIAVPSLAEAVAQLEKTYGLKAGAVHENVEQGVRLAYVELGNTRIELIEPTRADGPLAAFLEKNPKGGLHHMSLYVDDVAEATGTLSGSGASLLGDGRIGRNVHGQAMAFVHPKSFLGALLEIEEAPPSDKSQR